ncbi:arsenate reductase ArsC [Agromyces sp. H66]|uniref:arsenate reductase ArsC n=1 Tax=Agromyces sp. H66 TaxID=2529859 RepID=UPI0020C01983|nr:arsenate reductase ArsC [Agromyces sp. H66]
MTAPSDRPAPLDAAGALERATQVAALADPDRLRIMSVLANRPDAENTVPSIAALVELDVPVVAAHLEALAAAVLVVSLPGGTDVRFTPSPDAWVRFGRLLAGKSAYVKPSTSSPASATAIADVPVPIRRTADRLAYRFSAHFSHETVERYVAESYDLLRARAKTTRHLPSLTSRFASERLAALAAAQGFDLTGTPEVLFVCVQNSGRSQLAAGLLRRRAGDRVHVRTAGSQPAATIDDLVVRVLDEIDVPIVSEFPKPLTDEVVQAADVVVTMGCGDACPVYPGRRYLDWKIGDPAGRSIEEVRAIRDQIARHVEELVDGLGLAASARS